MRQRVAGNKFVVCRMYEKGTRVHFPRRVPRVLPKICIVMREKVSRVIRKRLSARATRAQRHINNIHGIAMLVKKRKKKRKKEGKRTGRAAGGRGKKRKTSTATATRTLFPRASTTNSLDRMRTAHATPGTGRGSGRRSRGACRHVTGNANARRVPCVKLSLAIFTIQRRYSAAEASRDGRGGGGRSRRASATSRYAKLSSYRENTVVTRFRFTSSRRRRRFVRGTVADFLRRDPPLYRVRRERSCERSVVTLREPWPQTSPRETENQCAIFKRVRVVASRVGRRERPGVRATVAERNGGTRGTGTEGREGARAQQPPPIIKGRPRTLGAPLPPSLPLSFDLGASRAQLTVSNSLLFSRRRRPSSSPKTVNFYVKAQFYVRARAR